MLVVHVQNQILTISQRETTIIYMAHIATEQSLLTKTVDRTA